MRTHVGRMKNVLALFTLVMLGVWAVAGVAAAAEEDVAQTTSEPAQASAVSAEDKTGTNPANIQNTLVLSNEFIALPDGSVSNKAAFDYATPINQQKTMSLLIGIPFVTTDVGGGTDFGFGDLQLTWTWITKMTRKYAWAVAVDSNWDTATKDTLGTGKHWVSPRVFYAMFLPKGVIFAPALLHKFDIGGDDDRADISQTILDLYYVRPIGPGQWVVLDPQVILDHELDRTSGQVKITYGRMISGGMSFYVTPAIPVGGNQLIDWSVEVGVKNVF